MKDMMTTQKRRRTPMLVKKSDYTRFEFMCAFSHPRDPLEAV